VPLALSYFQQDSQHRNTQAIQQENTLCVPLALPSYFTTFTYRATCNRSHVGCGPLDATNASKHSIDQSEDKVLQINQSKNASMHSKHSKCVQNSRFETLQVIDSVSRGCSEQPLGSAQRSSKSISSRREWRLPIFSRQRQARTFSWIQKLFTLERFVSRLNHCSTIENLSSKTHRDFGGLNSLPESQQAYALHLNSSKRRYFKDSSLQVRKKQDRRFMCVALSADSAARFLAGFSW